jgi:hypothetical protein
MKRAPTPPHAASHVQFSGDFHSPARSRRFIHRIDYFQRNQPFLSSGMGWLTCGNALDEVLELFSEHGVIDLLLAVWEDRNERAHRLVQFHVQL